MLKVLDAPTYYVSKPVHAYRFARFLRADWLRGTAPFDARCMLILIAIPAAWKVLSLDFGALPKLCSDTTLFTFEPAFLYQMLVGARCDIFSVFPPRAMQLAAAALLVATTIRPTRLLLLPGVALLWLLDTTAYLYRGTLYTLDTPLALLLLICLVPVSLRLACRWDLTPNWRARLVMIAPLMFVASYYVLAGIAKLQFAWNWPLVVKIGNYYPISFLWHSQEMPPVIDWLAHRASDLFLAAPALDAGSGMLVFVEQLLWLLAPAFLVFRFHAGLFAFIYHCIVLMTTGIAFITWFFIAPAVTVPFSLIARGVMKIEPRKVAAPPERLVGVPYRLALAIVAVIPVFLAALPSSGTVYPPFHNYLAFGWRYQDSSEIGRIYKLGWRDPRSGAYKPFPIGQGGFFSFRQSGMMDVFTKLALTNSGYSDAQVSAAFHTLINGTTGIATNNWLLGPLTAPDHLLSMPGTVDLRTIDTFYLMIGTQLPRVGRRPITASWSICGEIKVDPQTGAKPFNRYEVCRDAAAL